MLHSEPKEHPLDKWLNTEERYFKARVNLIYLEFLDREFDFCLKLDRLEYNVSGFTVLLN